MKLSEFTFILGLLNNAAFTLDSDVKEFEVLLQNDYRLGKNFFFQRVCQRQEEIISFEKDTNFSCERANIIRSLANLTNCMIKHSDDVFMNNEGEVYDWRVEYLKKQRLLLEIDPNNRETYQDKADVAYHNYIYKLNIDKKSINILLIYSQWQEKHKYLEEDKKRLENAYERLFIKKSLFM